MMLSLFLAKLIGLTIIIISAAMLANKRDVNLLFGIYKHPEAVFLTGFLEVGLGLSLVLSHNIWVMDYRVVITIIGWALLARGVARTVAPDFVVRNLERFKKMGPTTMNVLLGIVFLLGVYLAYMGFTA